MVLLWNHKIYNIAHNVRGSSNGRTTVSGTVNLGSIPSPRALCAIFLLWNRTGDGKGRILLHLVGDSDEGAP